MSLNEIIFWPAARLAAAIRAKELSALEVVDAHLKRIAEVNPQLNAVVQLTAETARAQAQQADADLAHGQLRGPLHGVPFTVKDSLATAGVLTTAGTQGLASYMPRSDATAVARLRAAGAILLGKTNLTELCQGGETDNLVYGRTNNPYDLTRSPGGSSGGEVAIIAAGGSPLGLGSDFGGSIRGPSHLCGIAGLNPTLGRVPRTGHIPPYGGAYDTARVGPMARLVEDLALVLPIIAGPDGIDPSIVPMPLRGHSSVQLAELRVAFHADNGVFPPTPDTAAVVRQTAQALADAGISTQEACPAGLRKIMQVAEALRQAQGSIVESDVFQASTADGRREPTDLDWYATQRAELAQHSPTSQGMSAAEFLHWSMQWDISRRTMLAFWERYDVLICPVDPSPALPHGATMRPDFPPWGVTAYTKPYSMAGWPGVVVRAGTSSERMPIGVQVVTPPWREDIALAVALFIENARGGWQPPPL